MLQISASVHGSSSGGRLQIGTPRFSATSQQPPEGVLEVVRGVGDHSLNEWNKLTGPRLRKRESRGRSPTPYLFWLFTVRSGIEGLLVQRVARLASGEVAEAADHAGTLRAGPVLVGSEFEVFRLHSGLQAKSQRVRKPRCTHALPRDKSQCRSGAGHDQRIRDGRAAVTVLSRQEVRLIDRRSRA